ncbi:MAG: alpha/beta fold hydrolase [Cyanobacteria bacterium P01_A01_bin.116]
MPISFPSIASNRDRNPSFSGRLAAFVTGLGVSTLLSIPLGAIALVAALAQSASAAERVTLTYGFAEISTSVEALRAYGERGEVNDELAPYIRFLNEAQRSQFRAALQRRQDVGVVEVSQFLNSSIGDNILSSLGDVFTTQSRRNGSKGLRGAIVLAATDPEGLSLLGVFENFPTNTIRIDSRRAFQALNSFTGLIEDTRIAIAAIESQASVTPAPTAPTVPDLAQPGDYTVTLQELTIVDSDRTIAPDSVEPRRLPVDLYLPEGTVSVPLIVASHGLAGNREGFEVMARHLASHGFAVAALDHPGSDRRQFLSLLRGSADEIAEPTEFTERPLDVSFLLDELTRQNAASGPLANQFDLEKIGIIGHSFGGYTALAVAGAKIDIDTLDANCASNDLIFNAANTSMLLQCTALGAPDQFTTDLYDERIKAVMAMNPITSSLFGPEGFSQLAVPSLLVAGTADPIAPALLEQIRPYTWLHQTPTEADASELSEPDKPLVPLGHYLALIEGGSHLYEPAELEGENVAVFNGLVSPDIELSDSYLKALSLAFVEAAVAQNPDFQRVLEGTAIVQLGQPALPLFVISSLTEEMLRPAPAEIGEEILEDAAADDATETDALDNMPEISPDEPAR